MNAVVDAALSGLVVDLEGFWAALRAEYPELPRAVLTVAGGTDARKPGRVVLGHWAASRWQQGEAGELVGEVMVSGEGLQLGGLELVDTMLHEAAHALGAARGVKDTSRQGRYHNAKYRRLAEELGLDVAKHPQAGWNQTTVPEATAAKWAEWVDRLDVHCKRAHRRPMWAACTHGPEDPGNDPQDAQEGAGESEEPTPRPGRVLAVCGCPTPRKLRISASVLDLGAIDCGLCGEAFEVSQ